MEMKTKQTVNQRVQVAFLQSPISVPAMAIGMETTITELKVPGAIFELTEAGHLLIKKNNMIALVPSANVKVCLLESPK